MKLILNEEQNYLKETALSFVSEKTPVSHLRGLEIQMISFAGIRKYGVRWLSLGGQEF